MEGREYGSRQVRGTFYIGAVKETRFSVSKNRFCDYACESDGWL